MNRAAQIRAAKAAGYRAYQGANGWYAAQLLADGVSHHAPSQYSRHYDSAADALAALGLDDDERRFAQFWDDDEVVA